MTDRSPLSLLSGWTAAPDVTCPSWIWTSASWPLAARADLVYSPLVDRKDFPEMVDVTLVEGAVSSEDDLGKIRKVRAHTKVLVSLGDCAVTSNVPPCAIPSA